MIAEFEKAHIECTELSENNQFGRFVVEPLERGFGHTLGNALRRVLLSSLTGAAVTSVQIDGVQHEFSTIPGVKEDVTEIILNFKELALKLFSDSTKKVEIDMVGPCDFTAGDIRADDEVEIINRRPPAHVHYPRSWPRLCPGGQEQGPAEPHRRDPDRFDLYPDP